MRLGEIHVMDGEGETGDSVELSSPAVLGRMLRSWCLHSASSRCPVCWWWYSLGDSSHLQKAGRQWWPVWWCELYLTLWTPWTVAHQDPLSVGFSRQDYCSGLPFPSPRNLPDPGIEPWSPHCGWILYHLNYQEGHKGIKKGQSITLEVCFFNAEHTMI